MTKTKPGRILIWIPTSAFSKECLTFPRKKGDSRLNFENNMLENARKWDKNTCRIKVYTIENMSGPQVGVGIYIY